MNDQLRMRPITAIYEDYNAFVTALGELKNAGEENYEAYGPVNLEDLTPLMPRRGSLIRGITTAGAIVGLVSFFALAVYASMVFALVVGGKPPVSNVPFVVPAYEGTILLGGIVAFIAVVVFAKLFIKGVPPEYDTRFGGDSLGIVVFSTEERKPAVTEILRNTGAVEITDADTA